MEDVTKKGVRSSLEHTNTNKESSSPLERSTTTNRDNRYTVPFAHERPVTSSRTFHQLLYEVTSSTAPPQHLEDDDLFTFMDISEEPSALKPVGPDLKRLTTIPIPPSRRKPLLQVYRTSNILSIVSGLCASVLVAQGIVAILLLDAFTATASFLSASLLIYLDVSRYWNGTQKFQRQPLKCTSCLLVIPIITIVSVKVYYLHRLRSRGFPYGCRAVPDNNFYDSPIQLHTYCHRYISLVLALTILGSILLFLFFLLFCFTEVHAKAVDAWIALESTTTHSYDSQPTPPRTIILDS